MVTTMQTDTFTASHQRRVADLADAIAKEMGLTAERIRGIRIAALIHDVGKMYVPMEILRKPSKLTEVEMEMMKHHPQAGHAIADRVECPWPVAEIVLQHHERMDGSGYPQGLAAEEILLEARILGVADVVEAMASDRPYRPAHSLEEALGEVVHHRGALYDPDVVDACVRLFKTERSELPLWRIGVEAGCS